jgi:hypothetical protein
LGLYLLARDLAKPLLRRTAAGLLGYAVVDAFDRSFRCSKRCLRTLRDWRNAGAKLAATDLLSRVEHR